MRRPPPSAGPCTGKPRPETERRDSRDPPQESPRPPVPPRRAASTSAVSPPCRSPAGPTAGPVRKRAGHGPRPSSSRPSEARTCAPCQRCELAWSGCNWSARRKRSSERLRSYSNTASTKPSEQCVSGSTASISNALSAAALALGMASSNGTPASCARKAWISNKATRRSSNASGRPRPAAVCRRSCP